jgi:hypothetical protein
MNETEVIINVNNIAFYQMILLFPLTEVATLFTCTPVPFCDDCGGPVTAVLECIEKCLLTFETLFIFVVATTCVVLLTGEVLDVCGKCYLFYIFGLGPFGWV